LAEATMGNVWSAGFANDIVVVRQPDGTLRCSAVNVRFPHQDDVPNWNEKIVTVSINGIILNFSLHDLNPRNESNGGGFRFTSPCLESMRLRHELNDITFTIKFRGQDFEVCAIPYFYVIRLLEDFVRVQYLKSTFTLPLEVICTQ